MFFKNVIGQQAIKQRLIQSIRKGFIPHAQLFAGGEGVGSLPLAIAYARYLNCTDRQEDDACGVCPSCVKFNKLAHPDLHFIFPIVKNDKKKKEISDDYLTEWRDRKPLPVLGNSFAVFPLPASILTKNTALV